MPSAPLPLGWHHPCLPCWDLGWGTARAGGLHLHPRGAQQAENTPEKFCSFGFLCWSETFQGKGGISAHLGSCAGPGQGGSRGWSLPFPPLPQSLFLFLSFFPLLPRPLPFPPGQRDWVPSVLGTSFCHFISNFPGIPKHWEQAGARGLSLSCSWLPGRKRSPAGADR